MYNFDTKGNLCDTEKENVLACVERLLVTSRSHITDRQI